jgi:serine/threonine protein kinase
MAAPNISRGTVRQGGKEEIRASFLKTYLLRVKVEKGERALEALLAEAGVGLEITENETSWLSAAMTRRVLKGVSDLLGKDALRHRGTFVTHPEALGTMVRVLRTAERPLDLYRYLSANAREQTRIATWDIVEPPGDKSRDVSSVRLTYRLRDDGNDDGDALDVADEELLCVARQGELASYPLLWGLPEAEMQHEECLARGGQACVYDIEWKRPKPRGGPILAGFAAAAALGGAAGAAGTPLAGALAAVLGGGLGWGAGHLYDKSLEDKAARTFERNRIAALERGLELRGEVGGNPSELTGTVLGGKYRIGKKIGSGGIGVVYAATHTTLGHEVAVKVLRGAAARDGSEIARLRREAYIQVHIEHPNVARVMDLDQLPDGSIYVVMERLVGRSLADKLSRDGLVAPGAAIPVFLDVARALGAAHAKAVVHRDLKPGNVFLCDDGGSKVLDFGMSKLTTAEALTQTGYTLGTPEYMAPEQCIGAQVEPRTDLYAFGVMMYEALTGELPIIAQNRRELLDMHQRQVPKPMRERRPDLLLPEALDAVIMKCLRKRIADRPRSAGEVEASLAAISLTGLALTYSEAVPRRAPKVDDKVTKVNTDASTLPGMVSSYPPPPMPPRTES